MEWQPKLDDVALFLAVADGGGLASAARLTGTPVPTLSRRMTAFERHLGRRLFQRGRHGYALTAEGRAFLADADTLRPAMDKLRRWTADATRAPRVRITAGLWTSRYLARNIGSVWTVASPWIPEFMASNATVDIARREADMGIRNRRPEQTWLAGRKTIRLEYAFYGRDNQVKGIVTIPEQSAVTPSELWLRANHGDHIVTTASDARLALDLALAGVGQIILPCFAGESEPGLRRLSPPIAEIAHDEWLVSHAEGRHDPPVRAALDAIFAILTIATRRSMAQVSSSASQ